MYKASLLLSATLICLLAGFPAQSQLCTGSLGDPVVNITFGAGNNPGPSLKAATTAYTYTASSCPQDGSYTLTNYTSGCFTPSWHTVSQDHTGSAKGYFMLVNSSYQPADFYLDTVHNLCGNTTYEFAAWILNMMRPNNPNCGGTDILPNITFHIETTTGTLLGTYTTGKIAENASPLWVQYGLFFVTPPGVSDVVLRMTNNAPGGCGNDLCLDDITFRPCGPMVSAAITGLNGGSGIDLCEDDPTVLQFDANISTGYTSPASQWQISTDSGATWQDIGGAQNTSYSRQPTNPGVYQYRLAVGEGSNITLPTCRVSSNVLTVRVHAKPVPAAANDGPRCEGDTVMLTASNGTNYAWTGPGGFTGTGARLPVGPIVPAQGGKYYVTVTNAAGCSRSDSTQVSVYPAPVAGFSPNGPTCEQTAFVFNDQSRPAPGQVLTGWTWDLGDGSSSSVESPDHTYAAAGAYSVTLRVTTDKGCKGLPYTAAINVHDLPHPSFSLPKICLADPSGAFFDSSSITDGSQAQFSWTWNFGDPNANATYPNTSNLQNPTHKYQAAGPYQVTLQVTSANGCVKDTTETFTVNGQFPQAGFAIQNSNALCSNQPVELIDGSSVTPGNIIRVEVYWDYQRDPTDKSVDSMPVPGKHYLHRYPVLPAQTAQDYEVQYVVWSGINCVNQSVQTIHVLASPQVSFDAIPPVCAEVPPYQLSEGHESVGFPGQAVYTGKGISTDGLFDPRAAGPGIDTLLYMFTATDGCSARDTQTVVVYSQPRVFVDPHQYVLQGSSLILDASGSGNGISYNWTPDSAMNDPHIARPTVDPSDDILYTLTVISDQGCRDSAEVKVTVLKIPVVPNAFSPNGDGINDRWVIRYLDQYPAADVQVFNRYGQPVFHAVGYTTPWDGSYKGQPLPVATYYYIIDPKNGRAPIHGSVTILR